MWHPGQQAGHVASKSPQEPTPLPFPSYAVLLCGTHSGEISWLWQVSDKNGGLSGLLRRQRPACWVRHGQEYEVPGLKSGSGAASQPWNSCLVAPPHQARLGSFCDFVFLSLTPMPAPSGSPHSSVPADCLSICLIACLLRLVHVSALLVTSTRV